MCGPQIITTTCVLSPSFLLHSALYIQQKDFSTAMSDKDRDGFYRGTRRYMAILLAAAPLFAFSRFVQGKLGLDWRRWLTEHMCGLYFDNRAFYALKIGDLSGMYDSRESNADGVGLERVKGEEQGGGIDNPVSAVSTSSVGTLLLIIVVRLCPGLHSGVTTPRY